MKRIKKYFALFIYYSIASKLPNYAFPGGRFFNFLRISCIKCFSSIGDGCKVMRGVYLGNGKGISIGDFCRINENVRLDNVKIGNHVMIARDAVVLGKTHEVMDVTIEMQKQGNVVGLPTIIEDDVWIGLRAIIMPSIIVKKGVIIGAAAVLTKSANEYCVYGGVPAKLIKKR